MNDGARTTGDVRTTETTDYGARTTGPYNASIGHRVAYGGYGCWWGPVVAGAVVAIAAQLLFTVLGMAIGISLADPQNGVDEPGNIGLLAAIWWLVTGTIALLIGGMVVGFFWGRVINLGLHLHALAMWSVVAVFGFLVIWSGAGMVTEAASPMAAIVAQHDLGAQTGVGGGATATGELAPGSPELPPRPEAARRAAQNAAWWSVIGLIIGIIASLIGGVAGSNAAMMAIGMHADVSILDLSPKRLRELDNVFGGRAKL
ncbi:MAG: hypothetical protein ACNA8P_13165, partial [Phycisphaerales bacterium]